MIQSCAFVSLWVSMGKIILLIPVPHLSTPPLSSHWTSPIWPSLTFITVLPCPNSFFFPEMDFSICKCYHSNSDPRSPSLFRALFFSLHLLAQPCYFLNCRFSLIHASTCICLTAWSLCGIAEKNRADFKLLVRAWLMGFFHYTVLLLLVTQK